MSDLVYQKKRSNVAKLASSNNPKNFKKRNKNKNQYRNKKNKPRGRGKRPVRFGNIKNAYKRVSKMRLHPLTYNWIEALVDPLNNVKPVTLPDGKLVRSVSFTDYNSQTNILAKYNNSITVPIQSSGFLLYFNYGSGPINTTTLAPVAYSAGYWMQIIPVDLNGEPIYDDSGHIPLPIYFENTNGGSNDITLLSKAYRLLAAGFRILPKVEIATTDTTQRVSHYYGAALQNIDIFNWLAAVTPFSAQNLVQSSPYFREYTNKYGICMRYNPCQDTRQVDYYSEDGLLSTDNDYFSTWYQPAVFIQFLNPIIATTAIYTYPVLWDSKLWLEADMRLPSPIAMSMTSKDMAILAVMRQLNNDSLFPLVVEGHSFKNLASSIGKFTKQLHNSLAFSGAMC